MTSSTDLAGVSYWDKVWAENPPLSPINPAQPGFRNFANRKIHQRFQTAFSVLETTRAPLLEVGCANSRWLPYFAEQFGFQVEGLDYSAKGCKASEEILEQAGIEPVVYCQDLFEPGPELLGRYMAVVSRGVIEHFEDPASVVTAKANLLAPGGIVVSQIPNIRGLNGSLVKTINRPIYDIHIPMSLDALVQAHLDSGLEVLQAGHFMRANFGIANLNGIEPGPKRKILSVIRKALVVFSYGLHAIDEVMGPKTSEFLSPTIFVVARKN